jgi:hypothetical protein
MPQPGSPSRSKPPQSGLVQHRVSLRDVKYEAEPGWTNLPILTPERDVSNHWPVVRNIGQARRELGEPLQLEEALLGCYETASVTAHEPKSFGASVCFFQYSGSCEGTT